MSHFWAYTHCVHDILYNKHIHFISTCISLHVCVCVCASISKYNLKYNEMDTCTCIYDVTSRILFLTERLSGYTCIK